MIDPWEKQFKEAVKETMTTYLKKTTSQTQEVVTKRVSDAIAAAIQQVAGPTLDETKIQAIADLVQKGAAWTAVQYEIAKLSADFLQDARPFLDRVSSLMAAATAEATRDLIIERLSGFIPPPSAQ